MIRITDSLRNDYEVRDLKPYVEDPNTNLIIQRNIRDIGEQNSYISSFAYFLLNIIPACQNAKKSEKEKLLICRACVFRYLMNTRLITARNLLTNV